MRLLLGFVSEAQSDPQNSGSVTAEVAGWFADEESSDSAEFKTFTEITDRSKRFQKVRFHPPKSRGR
jgi:hypothetical protein